MFPNKVPYERQSKSSRNCGGLRDGEKKKKHKKQKTNKFCQIKFHTRGSQKVPGIVGVYVTGEKRKKNNKQPHVAN
jgi:hypothetical protein